VTPQQINVRSFVVGLSLGMAVAVIAAAMLLGIALRLAARYRNPGSYLPPTIPGADTA